MRQYRHEKMLSPADLVRIGGMFARGMDTKDIASALWLSEAVVYNNLQDARDRTVADRMEKAIKQYGLPEEWPL
jgi:hypothetical protein